MNSTGENTNTRWSRTTRYIIGVGLLVLGIAVLYVIRSALPMLVIAALIAVIVRPVVVWLHEKARLPRGLAVALMYLILLILIPLALLFIIPAIIDALRFVASLNYAGLYQRGLVGVKTWLASVQAMQLPSPALDAWVDQTVDALLANLQEAAPLKTPTPPSISTILRYLQSVVTTTFGMAADLVGVVVSQITLFIFTILASIYISLSAHTYRGQLLKLIPARYQGEVDTLIRRIERVWAAFFRGQLTLMLVIGVISWLGLTALGVPGAVYLGIIAGLLELIPNLGPIIATIPAIIVALLQGSSYLALSPMGMALVVLLFYVLLQQVENSVVVPRVLGDAVELPPLVVMTGVLVGASTVGILGALLAVPVIATAREIASYLYRKVLGEDPFPPETAGPKPAGKTVDWHDTLGRWQKHLARLRGIASRRRMPDSSSSLDNPLDAKDSAQE